MTAKTRAAIKAVFEQGDVPQGTDYVDMIDSGLNLVDVTAQSVASELIVPTITATTEVSSPLIKATEVSASVGSFSIIGATTVTAATVSANVVNASAATITFLTSTTASGSHATYNTLIAVSAVQFTKIPTTAAASSGSGGAVPASAQGFLQIQVSGATYWVPYFQV